MRRVDESLRQNRYQVRAYQPGTLLINNTKYNNSVILTPHQLEANWDIPTYEALSAESLQPILALKPDVLLLGTGAHHHFLHPDLHRLLLDHRIGVEVMSTHAACRTFNALSYDDRHVAAALIIG